MAEAPPNRGEEVPWPRMALTVVLACFLCGGGSRDPLQHHRSDIGGGDDHVVIPLLVLTDNVVVDMQVQRRTHDLQSIDIAEAQVREVRDEFAVHPATDAAITLAGAVGLDRRKSS